MNLSKNNEQPQDLIKFEIVDAIRNGSPDFNLQITKSQIQSLEEKGSKIADIGLIALELKRRIERKTRVRKELEKFLKSGRGLRAILKAEKQPDRTYIEVLENTILDLVTASDDRFKMRESLKMQENIQIGYSAILETLLKDFEPGMPIFDKLQILHNKNKKELTNGKN